MDNPTFSAWLISLSGALFITAFEWIKTKSRYHDILGSNPEEHFTKDEILAHCKINNIDIPDPKIPFIQHSIRPLIFFVMFRAFTDPEIFSSIVSRVTILYFVAFFLYDDFIGKKHNLSSKYMAIQAFHWVIAITATSINYNCILSYFTK
jgi:hypothetical protein